MEIFFHKYQATGNDFIIVDNRNLDFPKKNKKFIRFFCARHFGIGADGLILLDPSEDYDFKMIYYNSDGLEGSMCGNGARCLVDFSHKLGLFEEQAVFETADGLHRARYENGVVSLEMRDILDIEIYDSHCFLDTGSPHHVLKVMDLQHFKVKNKGRLIRYGDPYFEEGTNVDFVEMRDQDVFNIRTYERGVEDETLSCGTGAVAAAVAMHAIGDTQKTEITFITRGGKLEVSFSPFSEGIYKDVRLKGLSTYIFKGNVKYDG